ncbi:MAG: ion transporter [Patescibacteria group bacterium]
MNEALIRGVVRKVDILLWIFSIPLIPIIIAEFFTELSETETIYFNAYYVVLWVVFTLEFLLRLSLAKDRVEYLKANWLDVLVVLTPAFRTLKVFNFMRFPILFLSDRILRALGRLGMNFLYYLVFVAIVMLAGANLVLHFEADVPQSDIKSFNDAVWWSLNYLTTTGSSAHIATPAGRAVGAVLMTIGFAVFSVLIASIISFFMREYSVAAPNANLLDGIKDQLGIDEITERLKRIERKIDKHGDG